MSLFTDLGGGGKKGFLWCSISSVTQRLFFKITAERKRCRCVWSSSSNSLFFFAPIGSVFFTTFLQQLALLPLWETFQQKKHFLICLKKRKSVNCNRSGPSVVMKVRAWAYSAQVWLCCDLHRCTSGTLRMTTQKNDFSRGQTFVLGGFWH